MHREQPSAGVRTSGAERFAALTATTLLAGVLVVWALVAPAYRASDEPQHVSTTLRLAETGRFPAPGRALMDPSVLASAKWVDYFGSSGRQAHDVRPPDLLDPPSMRALGGPGVQRPATAVDQMTQHPPGYYLLLAGVVRALGLYDATPDGLVLGLRLASALLLLPLPFLVLVLARQVGLRPTAAAAAAFVPAAWMQFVHASSTVNNGTLLVLATTVTATQLVPVASGDVRLRRALWLGAALSVALLTKGFALALLPLTLLAYLMAARRAGLGAAVRAGLLAALATLPGSWWWVLNQVRYGTVQPKGGVVPAPSAVVGPVSQWAHEFSATFLRTTWLALGWAEQRPAAWVYIVPTIVFGLLALVGTWVLRRRAGAVLLLHLLWVGPAGIVAFGSLQEFSSSGTVRAAQGRYVQTAVAAFVVLVVAALARWTALLVAMPLLVLGSAAACAWYGLQTFWLPAVGHDPVWGRVVAIGTWWPAGTTLVVTGAAVAAVSGVAGVAAVLTTRRAERAAASRLATPPEPGAPVPDAACTGA